MDERFVFTKADGVELENGGRRVVATDRNAEVDCEILMTSGVHCYWLLASPGTVIGAASINGTGFALGQSIPNSIFDVRGGIVKIEVNVETRDITFTTPDLRVGQPINLRGTGPLRLAVQLDCKGCFVDALAYSN